jgi:hypothetical protein
LGAITSVGRFTCSTTQAMVKDLPLPVTPSSVWWVSPRPMPARSASIACG